MKSQQSPLKSPVRHGIPLPELDFTPTKSNHSSPIKNVGEIPTLPQTGLVPRITGATLTDMLNGMYDDLFEDLFIIDCRFSYEFEGGHIIGAVNINEPELLSEAFFESPSSNSIVVFHCEFSQNRGPQMASIFREFDRELNKDNYPELYYPRVYVLDGGYKQFYKDYSDYCEGGYVPMLDDKHRHNGDLVKSTAQYRHSVEEHQKSHQKDLVDNIPKNSSKILFQSPTLSLQKSQSPMAAKMLNFLASPVCKRINQDYL